MPRAGIVNARRPGQRPGRSEAESIDDAAHGATIIHAMVAWPNSSARLNPAPRGIGHVGEPIATRVPGPLLSCIHARTCARGRRDSPARDGRADTDARHNQRWRERPREGALGSGPRHDGGVVHAIVGAMTSARALLDEAADGAASWSQRPQRMSLQAFACSSCSWPTRGERASGEVVETGGPT